MLGHPGEGSTAERKGQLNRGKDGAGRGTYPQSKEGGPELDEDEKKVSSGKLTKKVKGYRTGQPEQSEEKEIRCNAKTEFQWVKKRRLFGRRGRSDRRKENKRK